MVQALFHRRIGGWAGCSLSPGFFIPLFFWISP
jgi:hypothetical protein